MLNQQEREAAAGITARHGEVLEMIRGYTGITERERKRMLADITIVARDALRKIRDESAAREDSARNGAYLAAFGVNPQRAAEERQLRAELVSANPSAVEVGERMAAALRVGDLTEAKILAAFAYDMRNAPLGGDYFRGVLDQYAAHSDGLRRQMTALAASDTSTGDSGPARLQRLQDKLCTEVMVPSEVSGGTLESWAAEDSEPAPVTGVPFNVA